MFSFLSRVVLIGVLLVFFDYAYCDSFGFHPNKSSSDSAQVFMLYREKVPEFYTFLQQNLTRFPVIKHLSSHKGICLADSHPGNFGFITLNNAQLVFTYNDWDDSDWGPWIFDLIRFWGGASLLIGEVNKKHLKDWLLSFEDGLLDKNQKQHLKRISKWARNRANPLDVPSKKVTAQQTIALGKDMYAMSSEEQNELKGFLLNVFSPLAKALWLDGAKKIPSSGGSRGRVRLQSLWQLPHHNQLLLEMKPYLASSLGSWSQSNLGSWDAPSRYQAVLNHVLPVHENLRSYFRVVFFNKQWYHTRPIVKGNEAIELDQLSQEEITLFLDTVAWVLGNIHRKNLKNSPQHWLDALPRKDLVTEAENLIQLWIQSLTKTSQ